MSEDAVLAELKALRAEVAELRSRLTPTLSRVLTVRQAADRLGCSPRRVFELLDKDDLKRGKRLGRKTVVTLASVEALEGRLARREAVPAPRSTSSLPVRCSPAQDAEDLAKLEAFKASLKAPRT